MLFSQQPGPTHKHSRKSAEFRDGFLKFQRIFPALRHDACACREKEPPCLARLNPKPRSAMPQDSLRVACSWMPATVWFSSSGSSTRKANERAARTPKSAGRADRIDEREEDAVMIDAAWFDSERLKRRQISWAAGILARQTPDAASRAPEPSRRGRSAI